MYRFFPAPIVKGIYTTRRLNQITVCTNGSWASLRSHAPFQNWAHYDGFNILTQRSDIFLSDKQNKRVHGKLLYV